MFWTLVFSMAVGSIADCALPTEASAGATSTDPAEIAESSLFQLSHWQPLEGEIDEIRQKRKPTFLDTSMELPKVEQISWNIVSSFVRAFQKACAVAELYTSTVNTFPLNMVEMNNFSFLPSTDFGFTSYWPILSPDFESAETYLPYTLDEYTFLIRWQADLDVRIALFAASTVLYKSRRWRLPTTSTRRALLE